MMQATRARIHWVCSQVRGERVLDIGCSQGTAAILLARGGHTVTAVDIDPRTLAAVRTQLAAEPPEVQARVAFLEMDADALPRTAPFDSVILDEVLEHLDDPAAMLATAAAQAAPGGRLVVTVPFGVDPFPGHRQTFYFAKPWNLISEHFDVETATMLGRWIGFAATKPQAPDTMPARAAPPPELMRRLLPELEAEFLAIEQRLRSETACVRRQLDALQAAAPDPRGEARMAALQARLAAQGRALAAAGAAEAATAAELAAVRASTTYRLGEVLVGSARSPRAALGLPLALARLWRGSRRARRGEAAARALKSEGCALEKTSHELRLESRLFTPRRPEEL